ncbi:hypothetical protein P171DRAFT_433852 [Karstenula rhodostoma CBS 690.94]|uniref:Uncharacterized protein n=1 Tax=Karstenula rhodostoma CBS 690.94 TaxID=1392251 RepID=A0A9P4PFR9_9PLEO|nr:hypothetical protein P171DRAFT_433852 [Karstenula rhodostoma CBS 690.94]
MPSQKAKTTRHSLYTKGQPGRPRKHNNTEGADVQAAPRFFKDLLSPEIQAEKLDICLRNSSESPLLLNHIFAYVVEEEVVSITSLPVYRKSVVEFRASAHDAQAGLQTPLRFIDVPFRNEGCRQIYHLTVLLPYGRFYFSFRHNMKSFRGLLAITTGLWMWRPISRNHFQNLKSPANLPGKAYGRRSGQMLTYTS